MNGNYNYKEPKPDFTSEQATRGKAAVKNLSQTAQDFFEYMQNQPGGIDVYEYDTGNGTEYAFTARNFNVWGLSLDDLEKAFTGLYEIEKDATNDPKKDIPTTVLSPQGTDYDKTKNTILDVYPYDTETGKTTGGLESLIMPTDCLEKGIQPGDLIAIDIDGESRCYQIDAIEAMNI